MALDADTTSLPRMKMGETGYVGLTVSNGVILEEAKRELRFPESVKTFKQMSLDTVISSAIGFYEMMIARVVWRVEPPEEATETERQRAAFVQQCMDDMEHSWFDFMKEVVSMFTYGFCINEKVYRRRLRANGSRYNDGLVGLRKLPIRSQDTIEKWLFSQDGRELVGVEQDVKYTTDLYRYSGLTDTSVEIPRKKFMLFRTNVKKDNPEGSSPLKNCYISWKWRTTLQEHELIGVSREMRGIPVVSIPPRYLSPEASVEEKAIAEYYQRMVRNLHNNEQTGVIMPMAYDPESRQPLFKFELLSVTGTKGYDVDAIIRRYNNEILTSFFTDLLTMGQEKVGSFSLAGAKTSILAMAIEHRLKEIQSVLNTDLIPQLFALNGWTDERLPKFTYDDLDEESLEDFSKAIQRIAAVNLLEFDRPAANLIRKKLGMKLKPEDEEINDDELPNNRTRAGDGMATPGEGTGQSVSGRDDNASNLES